MFRKIRYIIEYAALRAVVFPLDLLPLAAAGKLAERFADLAFVLARSRRELAIRNLVAAGLGDRARAAGIARRSFRHFAVLMVESLKAPQFLGEDVWRDHVTLHAPPETMQLLDNPAQGMILATGHLGCWEVGAQAVSYRKPVVAIARRMNNPYADRFMHRRRAGHRFRTTPKRGASGRRLLDIVANGEGLAVMVDQHARSRGVVVDFFGRPAATYTSPARLHQATGAPICFAVCVRTAPGTYELHISEPLQYPKTGNRNEDLRTILEDLTGRLEKAVRSHPDQYLWAHRRWRVEGGD